MTKDDIIRMAREAGFERLGTYASFGEDWVAFTESLEAFAALIAEREREYGPISTALRDMAEDDGTWRTDLRWNIAHIVASELNDYYDWQCEPDCPLFYLFLAEALADEGM